MLYSVAQLRGEASARKGYYYAGPGNKFYGIFHKIGFTPQRLNPSDCFDINKFNIGLTDLVHTEFGNDSDINDSSYDVDGIINKMKIYQLKYISFNSKKAASYVLGYISVTTLVDFGIQEKKIGKSILFVLPSTSGSARRLLDEDYWIDLYERINKS